MALNNPTLFKGVTSIQKDNLTNNLLLGTQDFLSWGFLNIGGFQNITRSPAVSGSYGRTSDRFRLRNSDDPSYEEGQVWEGFRNDWVWESGFKHNDTKPIPVSGVWVDGYFYSPSDATYSHFNTFIFFSKFAKKNDIRFYDTNINLDKFWTICLNSPRFATNIQIDNEQCFINEFSNTHNLENTIKIPDLVLRNYKKNF